MFTSQSLRAFVRPGALAVRDQRLDDVVRQMELRATLDEANARELARRIDAALGGDVRWLIVDLAENRPGTTPRAGRRSRPTSTRPS